MGKGLNPDEASRGDAVVGAVGKEPNGHVVILAPTKSADGTPRVYDINQYLNIRDALSKDRPYTDQQKKLVTDMLSPERYWGTRLTEKEAKAKLDQLIKDRHWENKPLGSVIRDLYTERGNRVSLSFPKSDLANIAWARVENASKQAQKLDPETVSKKLSEIAPGHPGGDTICSEFVRAVAPILKGMNANAIRKDIDDHAKPETKTTKDPDPERVKERKETKAEDNGKPGGVAHNGVADVVNLDPKKLSGARFDETRSRIVVQSANGEITVDQRVSKDEMAVALKCVYEREINPIISMTYPGEKPDCFEVKFTGPLFDTSLGRNMFEADSLLGVLMFGYLGGQRDAVAGELGGWTQRFRSTRLLQIKGLGSRVFMCTEGIVFRAEASKLKCTNSRLRIVHETSQPGFSWVVERESVSLADYLQRNQSALREMYPVLDDFARLSSVLALLRWFWLSGVPFDWTWAKDYLPTKDPFPIFIPMVEWNAIGGESNLDGWQTEGKKAQEVWRIKDGDFVGAVPQGPSSDTALLYSDRVWAVNYDLEFLLKTAGRPVQLLCKFVPEKPYATIPLESSRDWSLFRITVAGDDITVLREGAVERKEKLSSLYAGTGLDLKKPASFGFGLGAEAKATISNVRFRYRN